MILLGALATGFGFYDELAQIGEQVLLSLLAGFPIQ